MADFTFKQGDSGPLVTDTLTYSDGSFVPLTGATVAFAMRALTASKTLTLTGATTVTNPGQGGVQFSPSTADTAIPGAYMANWVVTFPGGQIQTFPTQGYLWGVVEPGVSGEPQQLVSLPDVKDYLTSFGGAVDRSHDAKLVRYIEAATPLIENVAGPVIVRTIEEWHPGGQYFIQLRRRPSTALGTTPILNVVGCDEYRGPIKYTLSQVPDPAAASIYSVMLDRQTATLTRRTTGGGVIPFGAGPWGGGTPSAVHVFYQAGQQTVPANVAEAALEAIRVNYQTTMATGRGSLAEADSLDQSGPPLGFYLPRRCLELLSPNRRHPSIA